jgi:hypothetical protein
MRTPSGPEPSRDSAPGTAPRAHAAEPHLSQPRAPFGTRPPQNKEPLP